MWFIFQSLCSVNKKKKWAPSQNLRIFISPNITWIMINVLKYARCHQLHTCSDGDNKNTGYQKATKRFLCTSENNVQTPPSQPSIQWVHDWTWNKPAHGHAGKQTRPRQRQSCEKGHGVVSSGSEQVDLELHHGSAAFSVSTCQLHTPSEFTVTQ